MWSHTYGSAEDVIFVSFIRFNYKPDLKNRLLVWFISDFLTAERKKGCANAYHLQL
jgi:hypothetical protein